MRKETMVIADSLAILQMSVTLMERKLRNRRDIMEYKGIGRKKAHTSGKRMPTRREE
jgi:hypothetical protein